MYLIPQDGLIFIGPRYTLGPDVWNWVSDLFETLADEDVNSILTDKSANRAIQGNVAMQVMQLGGQH